MLTRRASPRLCIAVSRARGKLYVENYSRLRFWVQKLCCRHLRESLRGQCRVERMKGDRGTMRSRLRPFHSRMCKLFESSRRARQNAHGSSFPRHHQNSQCLSNPCLLPSILRVNGSSVYLGHLLYRYICDAVGMRGAPLEIHTCLGIHHVYRSVRRQSRIAAGIIQYSSYH